MREGSSVQELVEEVLSKGVSRFVVILFQNGVGECTRLRRCNTSVCFLYESRSLFLLKLVYQRRVSLLQEGVLLEIVVEIVWEVGQPW